MFFLRAQWGNSPTYFFVLTLQKESTNEMHKLCIKGACKLKKKNRCDTNVNSLAINLGNLLLNMF